MPCGNGLTLSKRKHGVRAPGLGLFSSVLLALCCVEVWGSEPRGCSPCPLNCSCSEGNVLRPLPGPPACVVNCSNTGLDKAPAAGDLPPSTSVLDLSKNHISSLDTSLLEHLTDLRELYLQGNRINVLPRGVFCCGPLSVLDLSNNQITTVCTDPCNLTQIDLSENPFNCDCELVKLVSWLQKTGVRVRRPESILCNDPPELHQRPLLNISLLTCGMNYAACLEDSSSGAGGRSELVIFSSSTPGNFSREQCTAVCLMSAYRYGGLGARRECLCSTNSQPNLISEARCSAACTDPHVMEECDWTLADDVFAVDFSVSVKPVAPHSVHEPVRLSALSSVSPVALSWDFGDLSPRVNTSETEATAAATHKYGLPGRYKVGVTAWIGHKEQVSAQGEVTVMLPPKLQLLCPALSVANKSLDISLLSWGALGLTIDWKISRDGADVAKASPHCPGGVVHNETSHCFEILPEEMNWTDARHQCLDRGGDLAIIRSETLRGLLSLKVTQERGVWLGLSDVQSPGRLLWVNGSEALEGEEGPPPRSVITKGNMCISLDQRGQTSSHPCNIKRAYVCELKPQVRVPDAGVYVSGLAVFPTHNPLLHVQADPLLTPKPNSGGIEVLLFPALNFVHSGRLSSLELDTPELREQIQVRFQIYRAQCHYPDLHLLLPGCGGVACAPVAACVSSDPGVREAPSCPPLQQWCPFQQQCLALSVPCQPGSCSNCSEAHPLPPGLMFRPRYLLQDEVVFTLPAGPSAHVLIREQLEDLLVFPGDVFALQHDAGPGSLLSCLPAPLSPWRQSVFALNQSEWFWLNDTAATPEEREEGRVPYPALDLEALVDDGEGRWLHEVVCPIRVLYTGHSEARLQGERLMTGLREPGLYSLTVFSADPSYPASDTCELRVVPPLGLTVLFPALQNGSIYLQPNDTRLLLRVQSRFPTNATWSVGNRTVTFLPGCPPEFASRPGLCQPSSKPGSGAELTEPSQFAVLDLGPGLWGEEGPLQLELEAQNNVTEASLSVAVHLEEPLLGLVVQPHPAHRVLMESVVSYTASAKGSNPTFKWTVDDKPYFTYYNTVLNVIYQHAAVYKLTVTAMNHVSTITEHFNVTVDRLVPMANLSVRGVPDVVPQGSTQTFTTTVLLDMSVTATFRWCFGDGGYKEFEYKPPYYSSPQSPESPNQVLLSNNVTYVYSQPGIYTALVSVSNRYENISRNINMSVYSILNHVDIQTEPALLLAGQPAEFEAHPLPSPYGIHYDWHFGDASAPQLGRRVSHTYAHSGVFNICVLVNNTISSLTACADMFVFDEIANLTANSSSPSELHSPTLIQGHVLSGNNVTWTFSMGDGNVHTVSEPFVSHFYAKEGNYTVNVTASNAVSAASTTLPVQVFVFKVVHIEPAICVHENTPINFLAFVTGNASAHLYEWTFGDGSAVEVQLGNPRVSHTYETSGNYNLALSISSGVSKASKDMVVCVQPKLQNISFNPDKTHYAVEEEIQFEVKAEPSFGYSYKWDFGQGDDVVVKQGSGIVVTKYTDPGQYVVSVTVFNNISTLNASISIEIQMPIGSIAILHNGTKYDNLTLREPYVFHTSSVATNVSYTWDFGDGFTQNTASVIHAYNISGSYNITLTAVNTVSSNQTVLPVSVLAPIRNLTLNSSLINVPLNASVNFEAHMDEGDGVRYSWILCDHCSSIVGTNTMFYTFRSVGTFTIIVTAENDIGTTQASILLYVQRELEGLSIVPEDEISGSGKGCCYATNRVLHLQADLKEGTNMTFTWNFIRELDPHSSVYNLTGKTVEVNFSTPGPCNIVLRAANLLGQLTDNRTVYFLNPAEMVSLKVSQNPVAVNSTINITILENKGSDLQYRWFINKQALDWNMPSKMHSFDTPGLKLVEIEVFNEVSSKTVSETISVQEVITGLNFSATNLTEHSYVSTGYIIWLQGSVNTGTNVSWTWTLDGHTKTGNKSSYIFSEPKRAFISLKACNDISEQALPPREVIAQDRVSGLELKANKQIVAVGEKVQFNVTLAVGTDAQIVLSISGDNTVFMQPNQTYEHIFTRVDTYMVNVTAHNQVNFKKYFLQVKVLEPIRGLSIVGCCPTAIPVGVRKTFLANVLTGSAVSYLWTFDLHHLQKTSHMSKEVTYKPEEPGVLTIYLKAFNNLHDVNKTVHILVQNQLSDAALYAAPRDTFINKIVTLMVSVTPRHTPVHCLWELGDGSSSIHADTTIGYIYKQPGHYLVQVNCSNQVSWALSQVEVNITVLECEEPEVQVVQAPRLSIWRAQPTLVEANVDLKGCVRYGEQYLWQILATPSCDNGKDEQVISEKSLPVPVIQLPEVDMRRLQLSLPKMSLPAGSYSLVFSLSYEGVPLRKAACLQLTVMAAGLMPIIEGGTYRVWSRTQDLQLSAEQSYDPNMDPESQSLLNYAWECIATSKGLEHCSTLIGLGSSDPVLGISGAELEAGVEYTFKLTISKDGMPPESTTQTVLVQSGRIPMVSLECVSCKAQSFYEVSQNSFVSLKGTCTNCERFHQARWTAMTSQNNTFVLDSSSTTTGSDSMHLVLRQGVLREEDSYIFTLHVTDSALDGEGAASITLHRNMPPAGGECHLKAGGDAGVDFPIEDGEIKTIQTLVDRVHFNCSGFTDVGVSETPLLYSLLVTRCREDYCEDFCVYRGSSPEHAAFLPPGFSSARHRVAVSITVEDHQGATNNALNKSIAVELPDPPLQNGSLPHWLSDLADSKLKKLLEQGDSQRVRELSLALITVLNEYEQSRQRESPAERLYRVRVRSNITRALTSLDLTTVNDIQQTSAALAQCTAVSREFICEECQNSTLNKLESMLKILQIDTKQGIVTPTEIADNILNIMGDLIHQVSQSASQVYVTPPYVDAASQPPHRSHPLFSSSHIEEHSNSILDPLLPPVEPHPLHVALKAYDLSSELMRILMHARVLNEEPLRLRGAEIAATGKLADPQSLLCYPGNNSPECQRFSIPRAFNKSLGKAAAGNSIMQLLFQVESNPFPFNYVPNYTVSTEVASMEFRTENGTQIPISGLDDSLAITVAVNNGSTSSEAGAVGLSAPGLSTAESVNISSCDSVIVKVNARNANRQAGLFVQLNFTSLNDGRHERDIEEVPYITAYLHSHDAPNEFNCTDHKQISLNMTQGPDLDHKKFTFFLSPESYDTTLEYFINVSAPCGPGSRSAGVRLEVGVFASLCQYFSESDKQWRTDGMVPLAETNATRAVCRTRHLTAFAAGLFVPPNAVSFKIPERYGAPSLVVLLVCVLGLLSYVVAAAILHKLDQLDLRRAGVVPLSGQDGLFKYEVQVKTGWSQGAGTTAHVGISLYGRESRSGHRHLDSRGAFARNALDIFHIATDSSLGSVWKIRIWHDNKGLSPAWLLQYVLVKDLQTGCSYYFLVDDWLSVDNDRTGRKVEIEVEASEEAALRQLPRLLRSELVRALCESHLWLSLWERPPRSPFTRLQRATCCALLLQLILMANTLWYSIVVDKRVSPRAVSTFSSLSGETVAAGVVVCLVVYPLYLLVFTLFRMSRSKCVTVEQVPTQVDQESVEIDDFLDNSMAGSSFLFFSGETNSEETNVDLPTPSMKSDESSDFGDEYMEDRDWPELMSEGSAVGGAGHGAGLPRLKRGQGSRHLGVDIAFNPDNEDGQHKYFTCSDEDLIKHILTDGQNFFPQADESEMADLSSIFGDKTEVILLQKLNEPLPLETVRRDPPKTAFTSNTVVTDVCRPRRFPPWCGRAALWGSWAGIAVANLVSIWAGHGFNQRVSMMWLISCSASVLSSCLLLEPLKVLCEAVYYALCVRRLRPEDQDVLVEFPRVERVVQRVHRVRPPQGFALSQARHQARKVHMLHTMLKNFLVYMFMLLVVILLNFSDSAKDTHGLRLRTQLQHALHTPEYHSIHSREEILTWLNGSLLPRLLDDSRLLQDTGSVLLGTVSLRQVHNVKDVAFGEDSVTESHAVAERARRFGKRTTVEKDLYHQFNRSLGEAISSLGQLQRQHWLNYRTRAVVVDFSLYNINTNLMAVFSFLFHFPVSERAQCGFQLTVSSLWPIRGLDLPLLLTMILFVLAVYFLVRGVLGYLRQGPSYLLSSWRVMGLCKLVLALSVCGLHLSRCIVAQQQWTSFLKHPRDAFTDFAPLARLSERFTVIAALLLFILVLKASHQLRFLREWAVFGRALRRSGWELLSLALALLLLLLAFAHTGHLLFHSVFDGYSSVGSACLSLLGTGGRGLLFWRPVSALSVPSSSLSTLVFHTSFAALRLLVVWFVIAVLLRNYRRARAELYRPAVDLQDYEMVELFLRRLKMWMGLSRAKEFRHKVRFEGMELPPSRSSSTSDCRSLCLPPLDRPDSPSTPDSADGGSESSWRPASSSPCSLTEAPGASTLGLGLGLGLSPGLLVGGATWKEKAETEAALGRVLPTLDALLQQLDRVTMATEDLYYVECKMEKAQRKRRLRGEAVSGQTRGLGDDSSRKPSKDKTKTKKGKKSDAKDAKKTPIATPLPFLKPKSASSSSHLTQNSTQQQQLPAPPPPPLSSCSSSTPTTSSLFNHPAHTTTIPTRKRKRKPPPLKNKVHPN